jgi:DDE superfamily endonuclease
MHKARHYFTFNGVVPDCPYCSMHGWDGREIIALRFGIRARRLLCWVFISFEPLTGWRELVVTERRTKREFAHWMRRLVEEHYPQAEKIRVVLDNLSTHTGAAFYENFSAEDARKLARRIEFCYTPVHGSWLNMVEIEISLCW